MKKQKGFTLIELLLVLAIIAMLLAIFMPALSRVKHVDMRIRCGANLKSLGNAMTVYSNDYDGNYPQLPGNGPWARELGFSYDNPKPDFAGTQADIPRTISASLYLLIRQADVYPRTFVCPESDRVVFLSYNPNNIDVAGLWDFGPEPYQCISYAYHNPYGQYPACNKRPDSFAVLADMSPWFQDGDILSPGENEGLPQILNVLNKKSYLTANSQNHSIKAKEFLRGKHNHPGQMVLYADGHVSYEHSSNIGVNQDNIYTYWSTEENPSEQDIQGGTAPTERSPENDAKSEEDSFLVI